VSREESRRTLDYPEFGDFFELSLDLLCVADFNGYFCRVNSAWEAVVGFSPAELVARPFVDFVHPEDKAATLAEAAKLAQGASVIRFENRYLHKDGSYRWFHWKAVPDLEHRLIYAIARDV